MKIHLSLLIILLTFTMVMPGQAQFLTPRSSLPLVKGFLFLIL
jgi:hypothetical protein